MIRGYSTELLKTGNSLEQLKAKRLLQYWSLLSDNFFFEQRMKPFFSVFYPEADKNFPNISFEVFGRVKGLISSLNKLEEVEASVIQQLQIEFAEQSFYTTFEDFLENYRFKENPFDRVRDFFAFRVIIEDEGHGDMLEEMYEFSNFVLKYFSNNQFEILNASPLRETGKMTAKSNLIFIPKKSLILPEYKKKVKDYAANPKTFGYQSVQFVIYDLLTQCRFECQVRTRSMDIIARTISPHDKHKAKRYGKQQQEAISLIDYSKVNVKGFRYFEYEVDGEKKVFISDHAGITEPIPVTVANHHYSTF